jgi:hypothetical protein
MSKYNLALQDGLVAKIRSLWEIAHLAKTDNSLKLLFEARLVNLDEIYNRFEITHLEVIKSFAEKDKPLDVVTQHEVTAKVDDMFYEIKVISKELFPPISATLDNSLIAANQSTFTRSHSVRLKKLDLQSFDGNFKNWTTFIELFNILVNNNDELTNVEKFQYLISSLVGEPLQLVKSLSISDANYCIAYQSLVDRYQNKRILASSYWNFIQELPKQNTESASGLRNLLDSFVQNVKAVQGLDILDREDFVWTNLLLEKLNINTRKAFEFEFKNNDEIPTFHQLKVFVESHCRVLESVSEITKTSSKSYSPTTSKPKYFRKINSNSFLASCPPIHSQSSKQNTINCVICHQSHPLYTCSSFKDKTPEERYNIVKSAKLCISCFSPSHLVSNCRSNFVCKFCGFKHNSLLHFPRKFTNANNSSHVNQPRSNSHTSSLNRSEEGPSTSNKQSLFGSFTAALGSSSTMLETALVEIFDCNRRWQIIRVVIDNASQVNFITEDCKNRLGLVVSSRNTSINGIGQCGVTSAAEVECDIRSRIDSSTTFKINVCILPTISSSLPSRFVDTRSWKHLSNLSLADPGFNKPGQIDMLIGADIYARLLRPGVLLGREDQPSAINTVFGWVISGRVGSVNSTLSQSFLVSLDQENSSLDNSLKQFWELEQVPTSKSSLSSDDSICESFYSSTVVRNADGRYVVSLPFKEPENSFPGSREIALRRFQLLENRLGKNASLRESYVEFMRDYLDNGHMSLATEIPTSTNCYYIPHHCVLKPDSTTTKIRVVFDASSKCSNKLSLNDTLHVGPKLLNDLVVLLLNFRVHKFVLIADVKQMYRQILIQDSHKDFQRIVWRFSEIEPVQEYRLNTVTYGVNSAPYLAIRTIHQIAEDEKLNFPVASKIVKTDVYMDDVVTGSDTIENSRLLQAELLGLFHSAGMELRKWSSNTPLLLENVDQELNQKELSFDQDSHSSIKVLGLNWLPNSDTFAYTVKTIDRPCTKRIILSDLARIFDPLGFLAPLTLWAKHLMQQLWCLGIQWDETPSVEIVEKWNHFKTQLSSIRNIKIPRRIVTDHQISCQLHGFCDASNIGYGAVVYCRIVDSENNRHSFIVCAKSKVAPLKTLSIPKLELCGAHLLAKLMSFVVDTYSPKFKINNIFAWSDSIVALTWIKSSPHRWRTFVANRVSDIQDRITPESWNHVKSADNPADCASRGLWPTELLEHHLWWTGPSWLLTDQSSWPNFSIVPSDIEVSCVGEEQRLQSLLTKVPEPHLIDNLLSRFSSLTKIRNILAYCLRFTYNLRNPNNRRVGDCSYQERQQVECLLVKHVQKIEFSVDILKLEQNKICLKPLRKLNPFLDADHIVRVGGRLAYSKLSFNNKHPILLPRSHRLTELIIETTHKENLHPGLKTLHYLLVQNYWILSPFRAIKHVLSRCFKCFRTKPSSLEPLMGNLPPARISQTKAFQYTGIDFGGPFTITLGKTRGAKTQKAYVCLFVCFATRAIHIELVTDLSTAAFLAALRRFFARRGKSVKLFSDCGTNFVGAFRELTEFAKLAASQEKVEWQFNPPSAPHFGGLWEAGIKSVKTHLNRVIGLQVLTFEELYTVLTQVEAVLNSRPLFPISSDPNDLVALTPGHFLTLQPLTTVSEPDLSHINVNRLNRWQLLQQLHQDFWKRWHAEYLHTLQQRNKWNTSSSSLTVGTMVLVKSDLTQPLHWPLGRIEKIHPGPDGVVRVVTVRTNSGSFKRPVVKLAPLPNQE